MPAWKPTARASWPVMVNVRWCVPAVSVCISSSRYALDVTGAYPSNGADAVPPRLMSEEDWSRSTRTSPKWVEVVMSAPSSQVPAAGTVTGRVTLCPAAVELNSNWLPPRHVVRLQQVCAWDTTMACVAPPPTVALPTSELASV